MEPCDVEPGLWSLGCGAWVVEPWVCSLGCGAMGVQPGLWSLGCGAWVVEPDLVYKYKVGNRDLLLSTTTYITVVLSDHF